MDDAGALQLAAAATWTALRVVHPTDDAQPYLHDLGLQLFELRLFADVALHERVRFEAQLPVRVTASSIVFRRLEDGAAFTPAEGTLHHRNETLLGFGDAWLLLGGHVTLGGFRLSARLPAGAQRGAQRAGAPVSQGF